MKIYRTRDALIGDGNLQMQLLEHVIWAFLAGEKENFYEIEIPSHLQEKALDVLLSLIDTGIVAEEKGILSLLSPVLAYHITGLYPEHVIHLVPEGTELFCLGNEVQTMLDNNPVKDVVDYLLLTKPGLKEVLKQ